MRTWLGLGVAFVVLAGLGAIAINYYFLYKEVKDLRAFKAETIALGKAFEENKRLIEQKNEKQKNKIAKDYENKISDITASYKRLRNTDSSGSNSMPAVPNPPGGVPSRPSYDELTQWYSELVVECSRTIEACTLATNQLECNLQIYR